MPSLLRAKIDCFYCGSRSSHLKGSQISSFVCTSCEATNFLDKNGEICDVPPEVTENTRSSHLYATSRSDNLLINPQLEKHSSRRPKNTSPTIDFCGTCIRNQHFYTSCLANYLPAETDPRYKDFEAELPAYRKQLELRYPPVCTDCEPRVREKLKRSAQVARTDVLERSLARSQRRKSRYAVPALQTSAWSLALCAVRVMWWSSLLVQLVWHVLGSLQFASHDDSDWEVSDATIVSCMDTARSRRVMSLACSQRLHHFVLLAFCTSVAVAWYHPAMTARPQGGRYVGVHDYYKTQALILVLRGVSWIVLTRGAIVEQAMIRGIHLFMLVFLVTGTALSRKAIKPAAAPRFIIKDSDVRLIDDRSFHMPKADSSSQASGVRPGQQAQVVKRFPIDRLSSHQEGQAPPSPPDSSSELDETEADDMDWEPVSSQQSQQFPISVSYPQIGQANSSPFYGSLPPAPRSMNARLRNLANAPAPTFHPTPASRQKDWFQKLRLTNPKWTDGVQRQGAAGHVASIPCADDRTMRLRESNWTLKGDLDMAVHGTGLEDLFGTSFSIRDENQQGIVVPESNDSFVFGVLAFSMAVGASVVLWHMGAEAIFPWGSFVDV